MAQPASPRAAVLDHPRPVVDGQRLDEASFERLALAEPDRKWELHHGVLREKPGMSFTHFSVAMVLGQWLTQQLDLRRHWVCVENGRLRRSSGSFLIPDVCVVPAQAVRDGRRVRPSLLTVFDEPVPFVVEVWSPSTGAYDVEVKLKEYTRRGDLEIWRLHPEERSLTTWRRQPDGGYDEAILHGGVVELAALPGIEIDLDALFDFA